ncbi:PBECR4 domain-containing protein [Kurthia gibsonii]|uniref:PBECR4 domain-containing protein n=1 Tax=Kurthia gibsonii TaxID=33946 RepID=UPI0030D1799C
MAYELNSEDLKNIKKKPLENEISLKTLLEFYVDHLTGQYFIYTLEVEIAGKVETHEIKLLFEPSNLCHLLGFQHIFEGRADAKSYEGQDGFQAIQLEKLTLATFKKDKVLLERYKQYRERILYFPFIYKLLQTPSVVYFNKNQVGKRVRLESDFIFYNPENNRYIHLGIDFHPSNPSYYFPRTFFVRKKDDYLQNQISAEVIQFEIKKL